MATEAGLRLLVVIDERRPGEVVSALEWAEIRESMRDRARIARSHIFPFFRRHEAADRGRRPLLERGRRSASATSERSRASAVQLRYAIVPVL